jgi:hypothetical protein
LSAYSIAAPTPLHVVDRTRAPLIETLSALLAQAMVDHGALESSDLARPCGQPSSLLFEEVAPFGDE